MRLEAQKILRGGRERKALWAGNGIRIEEEKARRIDVHQKCKWSNNTPCCHRTERTVLACPHPIQRKKEQSLRAAGTAFRILDPSCFLSKIKGHARIPSFLPTARSYNVCTYVLYATTHPNTTTFLCREKPTRTRIFFLCPPTLPHANPLDPRCLA